MKAAIVGSRSLEIELPSELIGTDYAQIISGGARGIDRSARHYAEKNHIQISSFKTQRLDYQPFRYCINFLGRQKPRLRLYDKALQKVI